MYSTYDEGKSFVAERFTRILKKLDFQTYDSYVKKMFVLNI